jgi:epoxyqueuosine reductase
MDAMDAMERALVHQLEAHGYQACIVSIRRLHDLQETIEGVYKQGLLDEEFYQERLAGFVFKPPEDMPEARSLIVVAFRDPQVRFSFSWGGEHIPLVVPPTYLHWREKDKQVEVALAELLEPEGYRVAQAVVPKKLLAVCSGLAAYGKNNITYVEGMGSFHRLAAFCSNLHCEQDEWREPKVMERCERCLGCVRSCPTGAIEPKRFLLRAERCIAFRNEKPGQVAFPEWVEASWHNCLVGCMHCQRVCPENRGVLDWYEEGGEFSEEETGLLLGGVPLAELPAVLAEKLERWDLLELLDILPRNLNALLGRRDLRPA